ncbi:mucin-5AC-like [Eucyclogobius newberryi]|uniref:mucin-5AC-like n=1 Tax=Eucyclogobius newberryi TaxID=166745 RepID=UPI003B5BD5EC
MWTSKKGDYELSSNKKPYFWYFCHHECWTQWFDRDDPSATGDWETLFNLRKENPGKICANPLEIEVLTITGLPVSSTGDVIYKCDVVTGFVCRNKDQKNGRCSDYKVRFRCPPEFCDPPPTKCWTQWFDRDDPSATGDWETLFNLRKENPGKICANPLEIEVLTITGLPVSSTGDVIYKCDVVTGFVCRNKDQKNGRCSDYKVRFRCPPEFCDPPPTTETPTTTVETTTVCATDPDTECWTQWFDRDDPSATGDWETLFNLRKENPGKICANPLEIEVLTITGLPVSSTGDVIYKCDVVTGFVCRNKDQKNGRCSDYKVRFRCPPEFCDPPPTKCWTQWFDRDDPSATGDWETLFNLRKENPGKICANPLEIEVLTITGLPVSSTGDVIYKCDVVTGFVCRNKDQKNGRCSDYKVRFRCPPEFCDPPPTTETPTTTVETTTVCATDPDTAFT